jgi:hypothetical protein
MKKKFNIYIIYYTLLGLFLMTQIVNTLYQTSVVVAHGRHQNELKNQQLQLVIKQQDIQEKLAQENSLLTYSQKSELTNYQLISQPIVINRSVSLAAAN